MPEERSEWHLARAGETTRQAPGGRHQDLRRGDGYLADQHKAEAPGARSLVARGAIWRGVGKFLRPFQ